ncbi:MAG: hypothetical protein ABIH49_02745 [archaeon]
MKSTGGNYKIELKRLYVKTASILSELTHYLGNSLRDFAGYLELRRNLAERNYLENHEEPETANPSTIRIKEPGLLERLFKRN